MFYCQLCSLLFLPHGSMTVLYLLWPRYTFALLFYYYIFLLITQVSHLEQFLTYTRHEFCCIVFRLKGGLQCVKAFLFCILPVMVSLIPFNIASFAQFYANWFYTHSLKELDLKFHYCPSFMSMFNFIHWWLRTIGNSSYLLNMSIS